MKNKSCYQIGPIKETQACMGKQDEEKDKRGTTVYEF